MQLDSDLSLAANSASFLVQCRTVTCFHGALGSYGEGQLRIQHMRTSMVPDFCQMFHEDLVQPYRPIPYSYMCTMDLDRAVSESRRAGD